MMTSLNMKLFNCFNFTIWDISEYFQSTTIHLQEQINNKEILIVMLFWKLCNQKTFFQYARQIKPRIPIKADEVE